MSGRLDVVVVGGGPSGLATAIEARKRGLDVEVLERSLPPIDKACGEGIMPDGVARLRELGVNVDALGGTPFRGIRFIRGELAAEGEFPKEPGLGVRRTSLHGALAARAAEAGVRLRWGVKVHHLNADGVETDDGPVRARWIVGADGLHSRVRKWVGLAGPPARYQRFGVRRHFGVIPWTDFVEVHWGEGCEAYVTPVGRREVGVAFLGSGEDLSFGRLLALFPALAGRLQGASALSASRGAGPLRQRVRGVVLGHVALVGDAAGYVDALTGEGLSIAFHDAHALAAALAAADLRAYERARTRHSRLPDALALALLFTERHPALRDSLIATLERDPALFSRLVGVHSRDLPLRSVGLGGAIRLLGALRSAISDMIAEGGVA